MANGSLSKGANVALVHRSAVEQGRLHAVVRWSDPRGVADVDVAALLLGENGKVRHDEDFVFYNAPSSVDGAVRLLGKRSAEERAEDRVAVDLEALSDEVGTVVIAASLDSDGSGFGDLGELSVEILDASGTPHARFDVGDAGSETAIVLGELYLRNDEWKFRAVGQGWDSGLAGLATDYGITVDETPDAPADPPVAQVRAVEAHVEVVDTLIARALNEAGMTAKDLDGVAAAAGPGLIGGVMVGLMAGKGVALATGKPFVAVNHLEAHALTARLTAVVAFPFLALLASGGHTQILAVRGVGDYVRLGATMDEAIGEAFDKTAKLLGLPYPG
ncbi:MAG: TerD family protein, partial [Microbacterium sp.]|uniref:TerD family protein n=1 Tax=Microbacterium sp. TaxID=51671 RepID=UPI001ACA1089